MNDNPYESPIDAQVGNLPCPDVQKEAGLTRAPFAHQAVRFSLYTPILLFAVNWVLRESVGANHPGTKAFNVVSMLMVLAAACLGVAGAATSFRPFSPWNILLGFFGALLNGLISLGAISRLI